MQQDRFGFMNSVPEGVLRGNATEAKKLSEALSEVAHMTDTKVSVLRKHFLAWCRAEHATRSYIDSAEAMYQHVSRTGVLPFDIAEFTQAELG